VRVAPIRAMMADGGAHRGGGGTMATAAVKNAVRSSGGSITGVGGKRGERAKLTWTWAEESEGW
jgi:hypothetical protein